MNVKDTFRTIGGFLKPSPDKQLLRSAEALAEETACQAESISDTDLAKVLLRASAFLYDISMMSEPKPEVVRIFGCHDCTDRTEILTAFIFIINIMSMKQKELVDWTRAAMATRLPPEESLARDMLDLRQHEGIIGLLGISIVALRLIAPIFSSASSARHMQRLSMRVKAAVHLVTKQAEIEKIFWSATLEGGEEGDAVLMEQITIEAQRLGYDYPR